jgi:hypothetical protein
MLRRHASLRKKITRWRGKRGLADDLSISGMSVGCPPAFCALPVAYGLQTPETSRRTGRKAGEEGGPRHPHTDVEQDGSPLAISRT